MCLPLAGHISDLGCDKFGIRARFRGRWRYLCSPRSGSLVDYRCYYGVGVTRGPNNIDIDVCLID